MNLRKTILLLLFAVTFSPGIVSAYVTQRRTNDGDSTIEQAESRVMRSVPLSLERAAKAVRGSTVTIRVFRPDTSDDRSIALEQQGAASHDSNKQRSVAVFSGVMIHDGFVAAPLFLPDPKNPIVRMTLPDGKQAIGRPRILDEYSGLSIIQIDDIDAPILKLCNAKAPKVGSWVVSGSAWGGREALVSFGMVSGVDFRYPAANLVLPPLIVCDLRAAETSKGSGIVSSEGKLIGMVMDVSDDNRWTYAVPVCHLHDLIRTHQEMKATGKFESDDVLVLKRQIPIVGIRTDCRRWNAERQVFDCVVTRVRENTPAEAAGLKKGDILLGLNNLSRRHGLDIFGEIRVRQAGDKVTFNVLRDGDEKEIELTLGGRYKSTIDRIVRLRDLGISPDNLAKSNGSGRETQLWNIAKKNLAPPSCYSYDKLQCLTESLSKEQQKNAALLERMIQMEKKLQTLVELINRK